MQKDRTYVCIDLKSFYASVECRERGLDPMTTNLVVADPERSDKTICLAVSPAMKKLGVPGRCRVFEIPKGIEYIMAPPRMQLYIDYSAEIYAIYLKYISKEDIHVYSIDEVFMDVTDYLAMYQMSAKELSVRIMEDILEHTGITATAGIGTNLYLAKVALDITAKHVEDHIGILDEESYCKTLWNHKPLTDFWRIGKGIANRLEQSGIRTMGEIAHADEDMLYRMFGVDAELLIDHAWGREITTMQDIKSYRPKEPEARALALSAELFTSGSLNTFAHKTNVDTKNRIMDYDIRELGSQLMPLGMLVTLDAIFNRVIQNWKKGKRTWIFCDEFYLLFRYPYSAEFFYKLWKRIRKYNGFVNAMSQNVDEVLRSDTARLMLANSEFLVMLNQASTDREELARLLNISDNQLGYITNVKAGSGLIRCSGNLVPFENTFPRNTKLYQLMTTKPGESLKAV